MCISVYCISLVNMYISNLHCFATIILLCVDFIAFYFNLHIFPRIIVTCILIVSFYLCDYQFLVAKKFSSAPFESLCRCGCYGEAALIARLAAS